MASKMFRPILYLIVICNILTKHSQAYAYILLGTGSSYFYRQPGVPLGYTSACWAELSIFKMSLVFNYGVLRLKDMLCPREKKHILYVFKDFCILL